MPIFHILEYSEFRKLARILCLCPQGQIPCILGEREITVALPKYNLCVHEKTTATFVPLPYSTHRGTWKDPLLTTVIERVSQLNSHDTTMLLDYSLPFWCHIWENTGKSSKVAYKQSHDQGADTQLRCRWLNFCDIRPNLNLWLLQMATEHLFRLQDAKAY